MQKNKLENIIVLKDMNSNIVEEAILILKPNVDLKKEDFLNAKTEVKKMNYKNMVIKEAENIIQNRISEAELNKKIENSTSLKRKIKNMKIILFFMTLISLIEFIYII